MSRTDVDALYVGGAPLLPTPGNVITGNVYFVHSTNGSNSNNDGSEASPFASIDYAVGKCTANNGDVIYAMPGHNESVTAAGGLDLDVVGITVVFLGEGTDRAKVTFGTSASADMDIDAANVTLINPKFVAAIDALTGPIDVNASDFKIVNGEYHDAASKNTTDCIVATSAAIRLKIHGWKFYRSDEAGTEKESNIQLNGVDDAELFDIDICGAFNAGNIECVTDEWLNMRMKNVTLVNTDTDPSPCIVGDANMTGVAENVKCRVASGTTYVSNVGKMSWGADCEGFSTDGYAGEPIGTVLATGIEGKIDIIDGYMDVATANTSTNTVMRDVIGNKTDNAASGAVGSSDSIVALVKQIVTGQIVIDAFHDVPTADTSTNSQMRDVVGNKDDAAAAGAVTTSESIMAYVKQLVGGLIVVDAFHDVPTADTSTNSQMRDVVGNKDDAAAAGAVTTSESIMAYVKQLVGGQIVVDAFHDVPTANTSTNAQMRDVVGNKTDTTAAGPVTTSDSVMAYVKQLVTGGISNINASHPRYFTVTAPFTSATWNTTAADHEIVTVTGMVRVRILPRCSGNLDSPANLRISLGTSDTASAFINDTTCSVIDDGEFWVDTSPSKVESYSSVLDKVVNGSDIGYSLTNASAASGGSLVFHVWWEPLVSGATCAAGAGGTLA